MDIELKKTLNKVYFVIFFFHFSIITCTFGGYFKLKIFILLLSNIYLKKKIDIYF